MIDSLASHLTLGFFGWAFGLWITYVVVLRVLFVQRATPAALVFYAGFMLALTFSRFSVMVAAVLVVNGLLLALSLGRRRVTLTLLAVNTGGYFIGMNTENFPQPAAIAGVVLSLAFGLLYWHAVTQGGRATACAAPFRQLPPAAVWTTSRASPCAPRATRLPISSAWTKPRASS